MIRTRAEAKVFLKRFEQTNPGAFALARAMSLTARVEPELLRAARLQLFRRFSAADEADFWFSDCVESSGSLWALMAPTVAEELRNDLRERLPAPWALRIRRLIAAMHANAAALVKLEESIHWLSLGGRPRRRDVETALGPVLQTIRQPDDAGVAQWAAHAIPRFSNWVRELPLAMAIRIVAEQRLGGTIEIDADASSLPPEAMAILRDLLPTTDIWIRATTDAVEISRERLLGGHSISVPLTNPIALTVRGPDMLPVNVSLHDSVQRVPTPGQIRGQIIIGTLTGKSWMLTTTTSSERMDVTFRFVAARELLEDQFTDLRDSHAVFLGERPATTRSIVTSDRARFATAEFADRPVILVSQVQAGEHQYEELAKEQHRRFGRLSFRTGKRPGDFATTIEVDGALIGIIGLNTSLASGIAFIEPDQVEQACGDSPAEWIQRHHATICVIPDLAELSKTERSPIQKLGFSFLVSNSERKTTQGPVIVAIPASGNIVGELQLGVRSELRVMRGGTVTMKASVPVHLRPLVVEAPEPELWVRVAGSNTEAASFIGSVARAIGRELARAGLGLITGGWPGVDEIVTLAYADALKSRGIRAPAGSIRHVLGTIQPRPEVPGERILFVDKKSAIIESVRRADAVLLLEGYKGVPMVAEEAQRQKKRVVLVPQTGGAAAKLAEGRLAEKWWNARDPEVIAASAVNALRLSTTRPAQETPIRKKRRKLTEREKRQRARKQHHSKLRQRRRRRSTSMKRK